MATPPSALPNPTVIIDEQIAEQRRIQDKIAKQKAEINAKYPHSSAKYSPEDRTRKADLTHEWRLAEDRIKALEGQRASLAASAGQAATHANPTHTEAQLCELEGYPGKDWITPKGERTTPMTSASGQVKVTSPFDEAHYVATGRVRQIASSGSGTAVHELPPGPTGGGGSVGPRGPVRRAPVSEPHRAGASRGGSKVAMALAVGVGVLSMAGIVLAAPPGQRGSTLKFQLREEGPWVLADAAGAVVPGGDGVVALARGGTEERRINSLPSAEQQEARDVNRIRTSGGVGTSAVALGAVATLGTGPGILVGFVGSALTDMAIEIRTNPVDATARIWANGGEGFHSITEEEYAREQATAKKRKNEELVRKGQILNGNPTDDHLIKEQTSTALARRMPTFRIIPKVETSSSDRSLVARNDKQKTRYPKAKRA